MKNIEEKILHFSELSPQEQQTVEAWVAIHPEWQSFLEEVQTLEELREKARLLHDVDDEALAYYAVAKQYQLGTSAPLQRVFARVEERLSKDAALRARYEVLVQRLAEVVSELDPMAQFEELTGLRVPAPGATTGADREDRTPVAFHGRQPKSLTATRAVRWVAAVVVFIAAVYGGLFAVSEYTQSEAQQLALVHLSETEIEGYAVTTRGTPDSAGVMSTDALYLQALHTLRDARITTLGLFPRYDSQRLEEAEDLLQRVIEREGTRSFLQIEAYFFLGKVHLAQGNIEAARSNFQTIAVCESRRTSEAVEILTELEKQYPAHEQSYMIG